MAGKYVKVRAKIKPISPENVHDLQGLKEKVNVAYMVNVYFSPDTYLKDIEPTLFGLSNIMTDRIGRISTSKLDDLMISYAESIPESIVDIQSEFGDFPENFTITVLIQPDLKIVLQKRYYVNMEKAEVISNYTVTVKHTKEDRIIYENTFKPNVLSISDAHIMVFITRLLLLMRYAFALYLWVGNRRWIIVPNVFAFNDRIAFNVDYDLIDLPS